MKYFSLNLTALSPLAIRADRAPSGVASAPYIAGTTLAGSLAAAYRTYYPEHSGDFERLFLSGQISYPNLYPASFKKSEGRENERAQDEIAYLQVYPFPKTALSCKRYSDFRESAGEEAGHGVRDSLLDWAIFKLGNETYEALAQRLVHDEYRYCPKCWKDTRKRQAMNNLPGYYLRVDSGNSERMLKTSVSTRVQTHTGIDRATGTVQEGILYSRQVFEEWSRFQGVVKLPDDGELIKVFTQFISLVGGVRASDQERRDRSLDLVRVGTGRTRGMGKVELALNELPEEQFGFARFKQRLQKFDDFLRTRVQRALREAKIEPELASFYFTLTLHSPTILLDSLLRYRGGIDAETLVELLNVPQDSLKLFKLVYQAASVQRVIGWNDLWGMPRMHEWAIESGSVFLFAFAGRPDEGLYEALFRLEREGIGERRTEGFGRVCISDPFHQEEKLR